MARMRWLLAAVIGMGVLIVVGTVVLVVMVADRLGSAVSPAPATSVALAEPAGSKLISASSDGNNLTLLLVAPSGQQQVEVRDLATGKLIHQFAIALK